MPFSKGSLPIKPDPDASILEIKACLGDLIEWALSQRISQLKAAGVTDNDLMRLRRAAVNYQSGREGYKDARAIWELMPLLEQVHITKTTQNSETR